jgi:hypothetical protein
MARKTQQPQTDAAATTETTTATTATEGTTPATTTRKPKRAPRVVLESKIDRIKAELGELLVPAYASIGEECRKAVEDATNFVNVVLGLVKGLPDNWKPTAAKGTRPRKTFANGEFVKAREKYLQIFKDKGFGAGPFKVLGVLPEAKEVKLVTSEGTQYVPLNQVERVVVQTAVAQTAEAQANE